jgi:hypothetical protein
MFFSFDAFSSRRFYSSTFCPSRRLLYFMFFPVNILFFQRFVPVNVFIFYVLPSRHFYVRRFVPFGIFSFDVLSVEVFLPSAFLLWCYGRNRFLVSFSEDNICISFWDLLIFFDFLTNQCWVRVQVVKLTHGKILWDVTWKYQKENLRQ